MSKEPEIAYGSEPTGYDTDNLQEYFEIVGRAEDGTILVRRKPDDTSKKQKAANTGLAILARLVGL